MRYVKMGKRQKAFTLHRNAKTKFILCFVLLFCNPALAEIGDEEPSTASTPVSSATLNCPNTVLSSIRDGRSAGYNLGFGQVDSAKNACLKGQGPKTKGYQTAVQAEAELAADPNTNVGLPPDFLTSPSCFAEPKDKVGDRALSELEQKAAVGDYYRKANTLQDGVISTMQNMAAIDSTLGTSGKKTLNGVKCENATPKTAKWCQQLTSCNDQGGLEQMAQQTATSLANIQSDEQQIKALNRSHLQTTMDPSGKAVPTADYIKRLQRAIDIEKNSIPWAESSVFQEYMAQHRADYQAVNQGKGKWTAAPFSYESVVKSALQAQLTTNRDMMAKSLTSYQTALQCLNAPPIVSGRKGINNYSNKLGCGSADIDSTVNQLPDFELPPNTDRTKQGLLHQANLYGTLGLGQCYSELRQDKNMENGAVEGFVTNLAITGAMMPIGAAFGAYRAAGAVASKAAGELIEAGKSVTPELAQTINQGRVAATAMWSSDAYFTGQTAIDAVQECSRQLGIPATGDVSGDNPSCPTNIYKFNGPGKTPASGYTGPNATKSMSIQDCVKNLAVNAALMGVPLGIHATATGAVKLKTNIQERSTASKNQANYDGTTSEATDSAVQEKSTPTNSAETTKQDLPAKVISKPEVKEPAASTITKAESQAEAPISTPPEKTDATIVSNLSEPKAKTEVAKTIVDNVKKSDGSSPADKSANTTDDSISAQLAADPTEATDLSSLKSSASKIFNSFESDSTHHGSVSRTPSASLSEPSAIIANQTRVLGDERSNAISPSSSFGVASDMPAKVTQTSNVASISPQGRSGSPQIRDIQSLSRPEPETTFTSSASPPSSIVDGGLAAKITPDRAKLDSNSQDNGGGSLSKTPADSATDNVEAKPFNPDKPEDAKVGQVGMVKYNGFLKKVKVVKVNEDGSVVVQEISKKLLSRKEVADGLKYTIQKNPLTGKAETTLTYLGASPFQAGEGYNYYSGKGTPENGDVAMIRENGRSIPVQVKNVDAKSGKVFLRDAEGNDYARNLKQKSVSDGYYIVDRNGQIALNKDGSAKTFRVNKNSRGHADSVSDSEGNTFSLNAEEKATDHEGNSIQRVQNNQIILNGNKRKPVSISDLMSPDKGARPYIEQVTAGAKSFTPSVLKLHYFNGKTLKVNDIAMVNNISGKPTPVKIKSIDNDARSAVAQDAKGNTYTYSNLLLDKNNNIYFAGEKTFTPPTRIVRKSLEGNENSTFKLVSLPSDTSLSAPANSGYGRKIQTIDDGTRPVIPVVEDLQKAATKIDEENSGSPAIVESDTAYFENGAQAKVGDLAFYKNGGKDLIVKIKSVSEDGKIAVIDSNRKIYEISSKQLETLPLQARQYVERQISKQALARVPPVQLEASDVLHADQSFLEAPLNSSQDSALPNLKVMNHQNWEVAREVAGVQQKWSEPMKTEDIKTLRDYLASSSSLEENLKTNMLKNYDDFVASRGDLRLLDTASTLTSYYDMRPDGQTVIGIDPRNTVGHVAHELAHWKRDSDLYKKFVTDGMTPEAAIAKINALNQSAIGTFTTEHVATSADGTRPLTAGEQLSRSAYPEQQSLNRYFKNEYAQNVDAHIQLSKAQQELESLKESSLVKDIQPNEFQSAQKKVEDARERVRILDIDKNTALNRAINRTLGQMTENVNGMISELENVSLQSDRARIISSYRKNAELDMNLVFSDKFVPELVGRNSNRWTANSQHNLTQEMNARVEARRSEIQKRIDSAMNNFNQSVKQKSAGLHDAQREPAAVKDTAPIKDISQVIKLDTNDSSKDIALAPFDPKGFSDLAMREGRKLQNLSEPQKAIARASLSKFANEARQELARMKKISMDMSDMNKVEEAFNQQFVQSTRPQYFDEISQVMDKKGHLSQVDSQDVSAEAMPIQPIKNESLKNFSQMPAEIISVAENSNLSTLQKIEMLKKFNDLSRSEYQAVLKDRSASEASKQKAVAIHEINSLIYYEKMSFLEPSKTHDSSIVDQLRADLLKKYSVVVSVIGTHQQLRDLIDRPTSVPRAAP
jgi:hypothetical protein